jgi:tRNA 2-selenouridine synthase
MATANDTIETNQFLKRSFERPILDVRSPKEFHQGHIPGAISFPLFTDEERAIVGTAYARKGKETALLKGLEIVGPKLGSFVKSAFELAPGNEVLVHCWRGGMRSEAMAWLMQFAGIKTSVLAGGYKAYRRFIRESFAQSPPLIVLGGMTGSGKTEILQYLSSRGEQVIDLEGIANHKGSAFGAMGQADQPTNEQFENNLAAKWLDLDADKPVWIEDESRNIGKVIIPGPLYEKMSRAKVVLIDVPFAERVKRLSDEYGRFAETELAAVLSKISKRIGADVASSAIKALKEGHVENAVSTVLRYYDKTYQFGISKRDLKNVVKMSDAEFRSGFAELLFT